MVYSSGTYEILRYCHFIGITNVVDRKQNFALHVKPSSQALYKLQLAELSVIVLRGMVFSLKCLFVNLTLVTI